MFVSVWVHSLLYSHNSSVGPVSWFVYAGVDGASKLFCFSTLNFERAKIDVVNIAESVSRTVKSV
jgi:hypothetical protein